MKHEKFVWTGRAGVARNGVALIPGQTYATADFSEAVVAEWIKTGNAKPATAKAEKEPKKGIE